MKKELSRRGFIGGLAMAGASTVSLGLAGTSFASESQTASWDEECDVLVIGGGGAGSAAAYGAAISGAKVIVLEGMASLEATSTALCGGFISFVGSPAQESAGIEDSFDVFYGDLMAHGGDIQEDVVHTFVDHCMDYYDLMNEIGVTWLNQDEPMMGKEHSVARVLQCDPADHQKKIAEAAQSAGADYRFEITGEKLVTDETGKVVGAVASDGTTIKANNGVVLATGGFTQNDEMLEECMPGLNSTSIYAYSCPGHKGKGHQMLAQLGAPLKGRTTVNGCPGMHPDSVGLSLDFEGYAYGAIDVDTSGRRFCDESAYYCFENTYAMIHSCEVKDHSLSWQILDQKAIDTANSSSAAYGGLSDEMMAAFTTADTLEDLADTIGAPNLKAAVDEYNADIEAGGADTRYGRSSLAGEGTGDLVTIDTAPFYAWPQYTWMPYNPTCSIITNGDCQPLDSYGDPIEGVYLAGEIMLRSLVGDRYPDGTSTAAGGTFGLYVGKMLA